MNEEQIAQLSRIFYTKGIDEALKAGLIPMKDLKDRAIYLGHCRNASQAMWVAELNRFVYIRLKYGSQFLEDIRHPQDDDGFDLFITGGDTLELGKEDKDYFEKQLGFFIEMKKPK